MAFKHAAVLAPVCFLLGVLFICFNMDYRILWGDINSKVTHDDGIFFYTTFYNAPPAIKALLHGMMGVCVLGHVAKLHKWDDSAMFFDGSSLAAFVFGIAIYTTTIIPMLRNVVAPADVVDDIERVQALQILSAANVIVVFCLAAVLLLQGGQEYARRQDVKTLAAFMEEQKKEAVKTAKKD
ncbi:Shr3 amino acid permease chaperone [Schizophyllum amplum]|uniref:Shr3 amino acid permease chaperone n=1 Tax=Schizophyllum amplum TaxID=97359 RepID=A0A550CKD5_9AGAR|nr:Shr3 amino acid permease chaperone [Auriculariopsis ampla]